MQVGKKHVRKGVIQIQDVVGGKMCGVSTLGVVCERTKVVMLD
jgi:hypothetical protein